MNYLICTNGRTGSNWLGQMLRSTRLMGSPLEFFNPGVINDQHDRVGVARDCPDDAYWAAVRQMHATNGVQGSKVGWHVLKRAVAAVKPDYYVHLTRLDTLRQAISLYRAGVTKVWVRGNRKSDPCPRPEIDVDAILSEERGLVQRDEWMCWYFAEHGVEPLTVTYEDIMADPPGVVRRVAEFMRIELPDGFQPRWTTLVQRDEWTEEARDAVLATRARG